MQKHVSPSAHLPAAKPVMELFDTLVKEGHLKRYAYEHPRDFYRFATRVMPYYMQYLSVVTPAVVRKRSFVRLDDGTEIDF